MDKVLNLMTMINEVDDLTNVADLKNKLQMQKCQLLKVRVERDEHMANFNKLIDQHNLLQDDYQILKNQFN